MIATGGSVVYSRKAMAHLGENGRIIYLETDLEPLKKRLSALDSRSVIRGPGQNIDSLYLERVPLYEQYADITIACNGLTPDQVLTKISKKLR
ncbi:MAG: shikimate kinase [Thermodesulfobacteriota bacterium]|nr:shikimate kinase [Thermodesulfobacteriota bacterium]